MQPESGEKYIFLKEEIETLCDGCRPKFDSILEQNPGREYHDSLLSIPFIHGAPNLKMLSTNALTQLKKLPSNAAEAVVPEAIAGRRKRGRVT